MRGLIQSAVGCQSSKFSSVDWVLAGWLCKGYCNTEILLSRGSWVDLGWAGVQFTLCCDTEIFASGGSWVDLGWAGVQFISCCDGSCVRKVHVKVMIVRVYHRCLGCGSSPIARAREKFMS